MLRTTDQKVGGSNPLTHGIENLVIVRITGFLFSLENCITQSFLEGKNVIERRKKAHPQCGLCYTINIERQ